MPPDPVLTSNNLASIIKVDRDEFISSFLKGQKGFVKVFTREGEEYQRSWGRPPRDSGGGSGGSVVMERKEAAVIATPHRKVQAEPSMRAWDTPVLKARKSNVPVASARVEEKGKEVYPAVKAKDKNRKTGAQDQNSEKPTRSKSPIRPPRPTAEKKMLPPPQKNIRRKRAVSERSSKDEEYEARLVQRRDRKRARAEIMKPKRKDSDDVEASSSQVEKIHHETTGKGDSRPKGKAKASNAKDKGKKSKIPVGLALIHGFNATNVGKNRITVKPPVSMLGVFGKGKASAKASVKGKASKAKAIGFSELAFLSKPQNPASRRRRDKEDDGLESSIHASDSCDSTHKKATKIVKSKKRVDVGLKKYRKAASKSSSEASETQPEDNDNVASSSDTSAKNSEKSSPAVAQSASWIINSDEFAPSQHRPNSAAPSSLSAQKKIPRASLREKHRDHMATESALVPKSCLMDTRDTSWAKVALTAGNLDSVRRHGGSRPNDSGNVDGVRRSGLNSTAYIDRATAPPARLSTVGPSDSASQIRTAPTASKDQPERPPRRTTSKYFQQSAEEKSSASSSPHLRLQTETPPAVEPPVDEKTTQRQRKSLTNRPRSPPQPLVPYKSTFSSVVDVGEDEQLPFTADMNAAGSSYDPYINEDEEATPHHQANVGQLTSRDLSLEVEGIVGALGDKYYASSNLDASSWGAMVETRSSRDDLDCISCYSFDPERHDVLRANDLQRDSVYGQYHSEEILDEEMQHGDTPRFTAYSDMLIDSAADYDADYDAYSDTHITCQELQTILYGQTESNVYMSGNYDYGGLEVSPMDSLEEDQSPSRCGSCTSSSDPMNMEDSDSESYYASEESPTVPFSEGKQLLRGISTQSHGDYNIHPSSSQSKSRFMGVSAVEVNIAKELKGHWLPQRL